MIGIKQNDYGLEFAILFLIAFSGNAIFFGLDLFFLSLIPLVILIANKNKYPIPIKLIFLSLLISLLCAILIVYSYQLNVTYTTYYTWPLKVFALSIFLPFFINSNVYNKSALEIIIYSLIFFVLTVLIFGSYVDGRYTFLFGPNMLYRIVNIFLFLGILVSFSTKKKLLTIFLSALCLYLIVIIGSRGGLVLFTVFLLLMLFKYKKYFIILFSSIVIVCLIYFLNEEFRILNFINLIENARFLSWQAILDDGLEVKFRDYQSFEKYTIYGFPYPHNIFLELIYFFGYVGLMLCLIISVSFIGSCYFFVKLKEVSSLLVCSIFYIGIFIGSLFSGDITDNYYLIGVSPILIYYFLFNRENYVVK
tara:strand:- start:4286 stop:5377 length:1092 start_codon:yes stop_codon:yes gene_type:complete